MIGLWYFYFLFWDVWYLGMGYMLMMIMFSCLCYYELCGWFCVVVWMFLIFVSDLWFFYLLWGIEFCLVLWYYLLEIIFGNVFVVLDYFCGLYCIIIKVGKYGLNLFDYMYDFKVV